MFRLCMISPCGSRYGALEYFTKALAKALRCEEIEVSVYEDSPRVPVNKKLAIIRHMRVDATFCFNSLVPIGQESCLAKETGVPHIAYLVDAPHQYLPLLSCELNKLICVDQDSQRFFVDYMDSQAQFLPHGVSFQEIGEQRDIDVLFLGSIWDPEAMKAEWKRTELPSFIRTLDRLIESAMDEREKAYLSLLEEEASPEIWQKLWYYLDLYIRARDRVEMLQALKGVNVHVYGEGPWSSLLGDKVRCHAGVSFSEGLALMRRARIVLNSFPSFKRGAHERIFSGMAAGALTFTDDTPFMRENFVDGEELELFNPKRWDEMVEKVSAYLKDEERRRFVAATGRTKVLENHSWEQRARQLQTDFKLFS